MLGLGFDVWRRRGQPSLGPERVVNGNFADGANGWELSAGWAVSGGQLRATAAEQNTNALAAQVITAGRQYQIRVRCTALSAGGWKALLEGGANVFGDRVGPGDLQAVVTAAVTGNLYIWSNAALTASFDLVSVREFYT